MRIGALLRLREILGREHAKTDRRAGGELHVHDSSRALARNEIKVRRLASDNCAERHERVEAIGFDETLARQRQLEAPGNVEDTDVIIGDFAVAQRTLRAVDEPVGEIGVEARRDDRKAASGAIRRRRRVRRHPASRCGYFI